MSSDGSSNTPSSQRREAVREKAQQVQAQQARARRARRAWIVAGIVILVGALAASVTWAFASTAAKPQAEPQNLSNDGFHITSVAGIASTVGQVGSGATPTPTPSPAADPATPTPTPSSSAAAPVDIRVYVDFLSVGARQFQVANVQQLKKWVTEDAAKLTYYPVAMLTAKSNGTKYSLRSASAAACVATHSPDSFFAYANELLVKQPSADSDGLTDAALADLAAASGASDPKTVRSCIQNEDYAAWVKTVTDRAVSGVPGTKGVSLTGTPLVLVNGTPYMGALDDPAEFAQFVLTIASNSYYKSTVPTPTPTPTATP
ncbi:DsbA family protein [Microbacterium rhizosphaerae]|uniref:Thioredoxin domain-containing protein n=1 Tax=Microbacterium rhizosphaerae TaxID=1678237 RepID=A0ABZ0SNJ3_9MICO|nr:thioredoxin domain-containing protein [Microbacterium rhizosphaerae]WPR88837.1 thioredoxin domain-containing protein [Microbacterium rhizosphaerae]